LNFFLFLLVNCVLFIRPADFIDELGSLYLILISACLLTSWTVVTEQLSVGSLERRPITVGVLGLVAAMVLSILYNFRLEMLVTSAFDFVKVTLFYLLMVGLVNSPVRLRCYLLSVAGILIVPIGLAVLHFYGIINHPAFVMIEEGRMGGTGMFGDPNDVCLLINVGMMLSLYGLMSGRGRLVRFLWVAPLALFAVALHSTGSRGGLLAFLASIAVLFVARYGIRKGLLLVMVVLPVILGQFAGRQVSFSITDKGNTGQLRSQLWSNALEVFKSSPIFGVGPDQTCEHIGRPPHNSFIQAYSDLGFVGATFLVGVFYHAYHRMFQLRPRPGVVSDSTLEGMRPYIMAAMTGYMITMMSTNHSYHVATYATLGMGAVYIRLADANQVSPGEWMTARLFRRWVFVSFLFLVGSMLYCKFLVRY